MLDRDDTPFTWDLQQGVEVSVDSNLSPVPRILRIRDMRLSLGCLAGASSGVGPSLLWAKIRVYLIFNFETSYPSCQYRAARVRKGVSQQEIDQGVPCDEFSASYPPIPLSQVTSQVM